MSKEDIIIDMLERGKEEKLSAEDFRKIEDDEELRLMCKDILTASAVIHHHRENVDVEGRLEMFKAERQLETQVVKTKFAFLKPLVWVAAAIIVCAFFLFHPFAQKETKTDFTAESIQVESENGDTYMLPVPKADGNALSRTTVVDAAKNPEPVTMTIPYGQEAVVNLADGSKVYLHPGSKLHFPNKFVGKERVVTLEGEAYFEVSHNPQKPFVVKTSVGITKVLGTEFDVTAYADKPTSVTLVRGKVEVQNANHTTILSPGRKAMLEQNGEITTSEVDTEPYTLWRDGYLYYDNMPLDEILEDIAKFYQINIKYQPHEVHSYRMRFMIPRSESVKEVVNSINMMQKVHARLVDSNTIVIE